MSLHEEPLVSLVTPVYNGEQYLAQCIESVLAQTYTNWEYIVVNNRSSDRTLEIAGRYANIEPRLRVHCNQELVGSIPNHNVGFQQISPQSKYCKVVHADDCLFPECVEEMVKLAEANPSVSIVGSYGHSGIRVTWDGLPYPSPVVSGRELCRQTLLDQIYIFGTPTSLMFRSDLVKNKKEFYNEANVHADVDACFEVLQDADFGFVHEILTYTRVHDSSITSSFSDRFDTYVVARLGFLLKYGPVYLKDEEYERQLKLMLREYYRLLGRRVPFQLRDKAFWDYQRDELRKFGQSISVLRVIGGMCLEMADCLFYPEKTIQRVRKKFANNGARI